MDGQTLVILALLSVWCHAVPSVTAGRKHKNSLPECGKCMKEKCPSIGHIKVADCPVDKIVWDECECCSHCSVLPPSTQFHLQSSKGNPCDYFTCSRKKMCALNMQGLPVCVCPPESACDNMLKSKALAKTRDSKNPQSYQRAIDSVRKRSRICGSDDRTYVSKCHMKVASCRIGQKIRVDRKGSCRKARREEYGLLSGDYQRLRGDGKRTVTRALDRGNREDRGNWFQLGSTNKEEKKSKKTSFSLKKDKKDSQRPGKLSP